jgi:tagatose-1,6-bisphosphate aldolase
MRSTGLDAIATDAGTFAVLAMDQRGTLRRMLAAVDRADTPDDEIVAFKRDMIASLAGSASAFLIDPTFGIPAARTAETSEPFGLLLAAEPASRGTHDGEPVVALDPAQDAAWVRDNKADALKFLVQVRADRPVGDDGRDLTAEATDAMRTVIADCADADVPSVIENLVYTLNNEPALSPDARADAIVEAAVLLDDLGPSLLKLEYPGSPEACRRLAERLTVPWAVLSAGVSSDEFADVLRISCDEGGASGFIAGRSVWRETVAMDHDERVPFLSDTGRRRLDEYRGIIEGRARSYREVAVA